MNNCIFIFLMIVFQLLCRGFFFHFILGRINYLSHRVSDQWSVNHLRVFLSRERFGTPWILKSNNFLVSDLKVHTLGTVTLWPKEYNPQRFLFRISTLKTFLHWSVNIYIIPWLKCLYPGAWIQQMGKPGNSGSKANLAPFYKKDPYSSHVPWWIPGLECRKFQLSIRTLAWNIPWKWSQYK